MISEEVEWRGFNFDQFSDGGVLSPTLTATEYKGKTFVYPESHTHGAAVRRLTPVECERLQGFPDGHTRVTYRGKPAADGPRYKALGNSMAVPCMQWIGRRVADALAID